MDARRARKALSSNFRTLYRKDDTAQREKWCGITVWTDARLAQAARVMEGGGDDNSPEVDEQWQALRHAARPLSEFSEAVQGLILGARTPGAVAWEDRAVRLLRLLCSLTQHDLQLVQYVETEKRRGLAVMECLCMVCKDTGLAPALNMPLGVLGAPGPLGAH